MIGDFGINCVALVDIPLLACGQCLQRVLIRTLKCLGLGTRDGSFRSRNDQIKRVIVLSNYQNQHPTNCQLKMHLFSKFVLNVFKFRAFSDQIYKNNTKVSYWLKIKIRKFKFYENLSKNSKNHKKRAQKIYQIDPL